MTQNRFLVTGATGDTGGYTVEQLLERGHAVRALAHREDDRSKRLEKMGAEVVIGDFLKFNDLQNGILAGTNDVVTKIGGRQPTTLDAFITKHRKAFA